MARGAAAGDFDNDGDLDVFVNTNNGPAILYRNDGGNQSRFLRVKTIGTKSNRDGIGAQVTITLPDGTKQWRLVHTGSSYCSQSDTALDFRPRRRARRRVDRGRLAERAGRPHRARSWRTRWPSSRRAAGSSRRRPLPQKGAPLAP